MRMKQIRLAAAAVVAAGLSLAGAGAAHADTIVIHRVNSAVVNPSTEASYATIQAAVDAADPGETVVVGPGNYTQFVFVRKTLTLQGAQFGVDARTRTVAAAHESVLANGLWCQGNNIVVDGFTVQDADNVGDYGWGLYTHQGYSGYQIRNNIFQNNIFALYLNSNGGTQTVVEKNYFRNNNRPGSASGNSIYTDFGLTNALIDKNAFTGDNNSAILLQFANDVTMTNNTLSNEQGVAFFASNNLTFSNNSILNPPNSSSIFVGGAVAGCTITNNTLKGSPFRAVRVIDTGLGPNSGVVVNYNTIQYNNEGVSVAAGGHSGTLNAECNYWGAPNGPLHATLNPSGSGDDAVGDVDFSPFMEYLEVTSQTTVKLLQSYASAPAGTYLQVVRVTNNGPKTIGGPFRLVLDSLPAGVVLVNKTGVTNDPCQSTVGSPAMDFNYSLGTTLLPGQSVNLTLKFTSPSPLGMTIPGTKRVFATAINN